MERPQLKKPHSTEWPAYPRGYITHTPTAREVLQVASRFNFPPSVLRAAKVHLPQMLHSEPYHDHILEQFQNDDPYKYRKYCRTMDSKYSKSHGWLPNVARLLICWVAVELQATGAATSGFPDHFKMVPERLRPDAPKQSTNEIEHEEEEHVAPPGEHVAPPEEEHVAPLGTTRVVSVGTQTCDGSRIFPLPPSANAQRARTIGNNERLKEFLRNGASFNKRPRSGDNYLNYHTTTLLVKIGEYMKTDEGVELLKDCEIDTQAWTLDHVWPKSCGGPHHMFNLHLMPLRDNSSFNDVSHTTPGKMDYVGPDQKALLEKLLSRAQTELRWEAIS